MYISCYTHKQMNPALPVHLLKKSEWECLGTWLSVEPSNRLVNYLTATYTL